MAMAGTSHYKTKQGQELLAYLQTKKGTHITANDISTYFEGRGNPIGLATIYRRLERLVEQGLVNKYHMPQGSGSYFEYVDREKSCVQPLCFHCKCQKCGTLIHLKCGELEQVQSHLLQGHGFALDPVHTVFYGTCNQCRG